MSSTLRIGLKDVANQSLNSDRKTSLNKTPSALYTKEPPTTSVTASEGTQTKYSDFNSSESSCQTDVSCLIDLGPVTAADLTEEEPSDAYWKTHCGSLEEQLDKELELSLTLSGQLLDKTNELIELEESLKLLEEALEEASVGDSLDIEDEK